MKTKIKITNKLLDQLPKDVKENVESELSTCEIENPYIKRLSDTTIKINEEEEKVVVGSASTRDMDRDNEIVLPQGINTDQYLKNPVLLWNHNWSGMPIGSTIDLKKTKKGLITKSKLADTSLANDIWTLVKGGHLRTYSIGFIPTKIYHKSHNGFGEYVEKLRQEWELDKKELDGLNSIILKSILLENSMVSIPANPNALVQAISSKSIELDEIDIDEIVKDNDKIKSLNEVIDEIIDDHRDDAEELIVKNLEEEAGILKVNKELYCRKLISAQDLLKMQIKRAIYKSIELKKGRI